jgi:hypothetical protein
VLAEKKRALGKLFADWGQEVFMLADMKKILDKGKFLLGLSAAIKAKELVSFLEEHGVISAIEVEMPGGEEVRRFRTERATAYELALSLKKNSYLSHYSAVFLHGLTDNVPKTIYTNTELHRGGKSNSGRLEQGTSLTVGDNKCLPVKEPALVGFYDFDGSGFYRIVLSSERPPGSFPAACFVVGLRLS